MADSDNSNKLSTADKRLVRCAVSIAGAEVVKGNRAALKLLCKFLLQMLATIGRSPEYCRGAESQIGDIIELFTPWTLTVEEEFSVQQKALEQKDLGVYRRENGRCNVNQEKLQSLAEAIYADLTPRRRNSARTIHQIQQLLTGILSSYGKTPIGKWTKSEIADVRSDLEDARHFSGLGPGAFYLHTSAYAYIKLRALSTSRGSDISAENERALFRELLWVCLRFYNETFQASLTLPVLWPTPGENEWNNDEYKYSEIDKSLKNEAFNICFTARLSSSSLEEEERLGQQALEQLAARARHPNLLEGAEAGGQPVGSSGFGQQQEQQAAHHCYGQPQGQQDHQHQDNPVQASYDQVGANNQDGRNGSFQHSFPEAQIPTSHGGGNVRSQSSVPEDQAPHSHGNRNGSSQSSFCEGQAQSRNTRSQPSFCKAQASTSHCGGNVRSQPSVPEDQSLTSHDGGNVRSQPSLCEAQAPHNHGGGNGGSQSPFRDICSQVSFCEAQSLSSHVGGNVGSQPSLCEAQAPYNHSGGNGGSQSPFCEAQAPHTHGGRYCGSQSPFHEAQAPHTHGGRYGGCHPFLREASAPHSYGGGNIHSHPSVHEAEASYSQGGGYDGSQLSLPEAQARLNQGGEYGDIHQQGHATFSAHGQNGGYGGFQQQHASLSGQAQPPHDQGSGYGGFQQHGHTSFTGYRQNSECYGFQQQHASLTGQAQAPHNRGGGYGRVQQQQHLSNNSRQSSKRNKRKKRSQTFAQFRAWQKANEQGPPY